MDDESPFLLLLFGLILFSNISIKIESTTTEEVEPIVVEEPVVVEEDILPLEEEEDKPEIFKTRTWNPVTKRYE